MSEIDIRRPETFVFTDESIEFATLLLAEFEQETSQPPTPVGLDATDRSNQRLFESDMEKQKSLEGTGFLYFGHTRSLTPIMYKALVKGYNPTELQLSSSDEDDFMWDEIYELSNEHPDISKAIQKYGYGSTETPISIPFVGAYAIPRDIVTKMLATLYLRGQEYRSWGWGFPRWGDELPEISGGSEAVKE